MLNELHKYLQIKKNLPPKSRLVVAVSGGVDSAVLLHLLHNLRNQYGWDIIVAHYNHGMRKDATSDALLVGGLAESYGYPFFLGKYEYTNFSEASLRRARYEFLETIRRDSGANLVVTAHHNNDFLETALFNTVRGADREGMVAMKARRGNVVRPLLPFSKAEIITFANLQNLAYREDSTNSDIRYSRNFVRHVLMPHGSVKFRSFTHNLNRRLTRIQELNQKISLGLDRLAVQVVSHEDQKSIEVQRAHFGKLDYEIQKSLFVYLVKRLTSVHSLSKKNINIAVGFIQGSRSGAVLNLPGGLYLVNTYDTLIITSDSKAFVGAQKEVLHALSDTQPFKNALFALSIAKKGHDTMRVPTQKLYVRYRQSGDKIYPIGMPGSKKLQDVFVDAKIPKHLRSHWPVVITASNDIVMVPKLVSDRRFVESKTGKYQYLRCEVI